MTDTARGVIVLVFLCLFFGWCGTQVCGPPVPQRPDSISAYLMSRSFVKDRLKAPATSEFPWYSDRGVHVTDLGADRYEVKAYVDAQNSFGANIRSSYTCLLKYEGNDKWRLESMDIK